MLQFSGGRSERSCFSLVIRTGRWRRKASPSMLPHALRSGGIHLRSVNESETPKRCSVEPRNRRRRSRPQEDSRPSKLATIHCDKESPAYSTQHTDLSQLKRPRRFATRQGLGLHATRASRFTDCVNAKGLMSRMIYRQAEKIVFRSKIESKTWGMADFETWSDGRRSSWSGLEAVGVAVRSDDCTFRATRTLVFLTARFPL